MIIKVVLKILIPVCFVLCFWMTVLYYQAKAIRKEKKADKKPKAVVIEIDRLLDFDR